MPTVEFHLNREQRRTLLQSAMSDLQSYLVGFVGLRPAAGDFDLGGSGTLVEIGEVRGILTAAHVVRNLTPEVGLVAEVRPTSERSPHNVKFERLHCREFLFEPTGDEADGPDLAFLIPPPDTISILQAKKSFYNLARRRDRMVQSPVSRDHGLWVLSGFIGERTVELPPPRGLDDVKGFSGFYAEGQVVDGTTRGDFDYLTFQALYNELYEGPEAWGGASGGGLWQIGLESKDGEVRIAEKLMSGVAYFQTHKTPTPEGLVRDIYCHGRRSIYGPLFDKVAGA